MCLSLVCPLVFSHHPALLTAVVARVQKIIQADPERLTVTKNASFAIALATEMMIQHLAVTTHNVVKTERRPRRNIQYRDVSSAVSRTDNLEFLVDVVPKTMQYGVYRKRKAAAAAEDEQAQQEREGGTANVAEAKANVVEAKGKEMQTTLPGISMQSSAAKELLTRAGDGQTTTTTTTNTIANASATPTAETAQNGTQLDPLARTELVPPVPETEAMDVDDARIADSEGEGDEDPAAMQLEMEMRGPPDQHGTGKAPTERVRASPAPQASSGGFTAINGR